MFFGDTVYNVHLLAASLSVALRRSVHRPRASNFSK